LGVIMTNTEIKFHILLFTLSSSSKISDPLSYCHSNHDSVEIPPKTRYKQKQNETHYENITHFIHLTLKNTTLGVLHNMCNYD
jgi:hypothetical protein